MLKAAIIPDKKDTIPIINVIHILNTVIDLGDNDFFFKTPPTFKIDTIIIHSIAF